MVSFKNESSGGQRVHKRKKKALPVGLLIVLLLLVVVAGAFGVLKFWQNSLNDTISMQEEKIKTEKTLMLKDMNGESADFFKRAEVMESDIYKKHSSAIVLSKIEEIIVPRVVLISFSHSIEGKSDGEKIIITADADEFEFMAQQIARFKKSDFFGNVRASDIGRNKDGRIVFTINADIISKEDLMFTPDSEQKQSGVTQNEATQATQATQQLPQESQRTR